MVENPIPAEVEIWTVARNGNEHFWLVFHNFDTALKNEIGFQ